MTSDEEAAAIRAITRSRDAGFRFLHLHDERGEVQAVHAERRHAGAVDCYTVCSPTEAFAARFREDEYGRGPLWRITGTAVEVITELLALPAHGSPGAPTRTTRTPSGLWLPGS